MTACTSCTSPAEASRVTLLSGRDCCSWCPDWRAECAERESEARAILRMPSSEARLSQLEAIKASRGVEHHARLQTVVRDLWNLRRQAAKQESTT